MGHWAETQASTLNIPQVRNVPGTGFPDALILLTFMLFQEVQ